MNSRQLQYAVLLSQVRNFSQVAEKLDITQPALSKQILNLEHELGVRLFDRNTIPLTLTPAGEYFIHHAQNLLYREDQLLRSMEQFRSGEAGKLVIGISPFRSLYIIPELVKKISSRFPGVRICLHEAGSDVLRKEAAEGKYDFAIVNLPVDESVLDTVPLEPDLLVLAVPNALLDRLPAAVRSKEEPLDMKSCAELPFVVVTPAQEMRRLFDRLCAREDTAPRVVMEVVGLATAWAMTQAGIGATLLPLQFVSSSFSQDKDVTLFPLREKTYDRQPVIVMRRGQYISPCAQYALELLSENPQNQKALR